MFFKQCSSACFSHASYLLVRDVESGRVAVSFMARPAWVKAAAPLPIGGMAGRLAAAKATRLVDERCPYRSMIAASVMRAAGFCDVSDLIGGYGAWETAVWAAGAVRA